MILVTGSEGFIGSHVMEALRRDGEAVVGMDIRGQTVGAWGDIRYTDGLAKVVHNLKPDAVIHLAARVGVRDSLNDPRGYLETNVIGTQNLLDACQKAGVKQVVLASTSSVYGNTEHQVETDLPKPRSPYAASKLGMEALGRVYHELYGMNVALLRLFSVYGERIRPDLMVSQIMQSITTGTPVTLFNRGNLYRDWTYVGDVVTGIRAALTVQGCEIINIGHGVPVSVRVLVESLENLSGGRATIVHADAPLTEPLRTHASIGKALSLLDWTADISLSDGLRRTWAWYQETHTAFLRNEQALA